VVAWSGSNSQSQAGEKSKGEELRVIFFVKFQKGSSEMRLAEVDLLLLCQSPSDEE